MRINQVNCLQNNQQAQNFTSSMPVGNLERGLERIRIKNDNEGAPGKLRSFIGNAAFWGGIGTCLYEMFELPRHPEDGINILGACALCVVVAAAGAIVLTNTFTKILNAFKRH